MANAKISALPAATAVASTDLLAIVQGGVTKKATASLILPTLTGSADPNGSVTGVQGQIYTQISGGTATLWINTTGGTVWI
jgi:hypothetical protein